MKSILTIISVCLLTLMSHIPVETNERATKYIDQYKHLAISEMERTGIPASIKLAQGLLESGWGESSLAREANNHFGIKCGSSWTGGEYFLHDDDYKNGKKIKSCFRVFASAHESYIAHSEFLSNPKKERYALLFYFPPTDYKAWAHGLKDAGYATDPKYPSKLISLIEQYELHKYDGNGEIVAYQSDQIDMPDYAYLGDYETSSHTESTNEKHLVQEQEPMMITEQRGANTGSSHINHQSKTYRRHIDSTRSIKDKIFKKDKSERDNSLKNKDYHTIVEGEKMRDLARRYGIPSALLYSKNRMPLGTQPLVGEKIQLKGTVRIGDRPKFDYPSRSGQVSEFVFEGQE